MITKEQIKAARAMLDWSQKMLAEQCGDVSEPTIKLIETGRVNSTPATLGAIQSCLEEAGIEFMPNSGLRFRDDTVTVLEKSGPEDNIYIRLLDDVYYTLQKSSGELLINFADNARSSAPVVNKQVYLRKAGISMRFLVRDGDSYFLYPLDEYRTLPKGFFVNNPILIYREKVAIIVPNEKDQSTEKIIIIRNPSIAELHRKQFELFWSEGKQPQKTTAKERYD